MTLLDLQPDTRVEVGARRAVIYLRLSQDRDGNELAVERQREDCLRRAAERGWDVVAIYSDNDKSAAGHQKRPGFRALMSDIREGRADVIIAYAFERLQRNSRERLEVIETLRRVEGALSFVNGMDLDCSTATGRWMAEQIGSLASMEIELKSERQVRSNQQSRQMGVPPGGSKRGFGYTRLMKSAKSIQMSGATRVGADGRTYPAYGHEPLEPEAEAVRQAYRDLLGGMSVSAIARNLNEQGFTNTSGEAWIPHTVRGLLLSPRNAGLVAPPRPRGADGAYISTAKHYASLLLDELQQGTWEPLVSEETWRAAQTILANPMRWTGRHGRRSWLLTGIATCGICHAPLKSGRAGKPSAASEGAEYTYRCSQSPHLGRKRDDVDEHIENLVIFRIEQMGEALLQRDENVDLHEKLAELQARARGVTELYDEGLRDLESTKRALSAIKAEKDLLIDTMTDESRIVALGDLVRAKNTEEYWESMPIERKRAAVRSLFTKIEVSSPGRGSRAPRDPLKRADYLGRYIHAEYA